MSPMTNRNLKIILALAYLGLYGYSLCFAISVGSGPGGGMQWVFPVLLGIPWSLLTGGLMVILPNHSTGMLVRVAVFTLVFLIPPLVNAYLLLRIQGIFFRPMPKEVPPAEETDQRG